MEQQNQIWLKPKPTHIDENFEEFLEYLKKSSNTNDLLYLESIRLLKERVEIMVNDRIKKPIYRYNKEQNELRFEIRLCGAWLLCITNATEEEHKQVFIIMLNNLIQLCLQKSQTTIN